MKKSTTKMSLAYSLYSKKKPTINTESEVLSKEIQHKIKLINKAFR